MMGLNQFAWNGGKYLMGPSGGGETKIVTSVIPEAAREHVVFRRAELLVVFQVAIKPQRRLPILLTH